MMNSKMKDRMGRAMAMRGDMADKMGRAMSKGMKKKPKVKKMMGGGMPGYKDGGMPGSYRKAADGVATRGKTRGTEIKMRKGGMC